MRAAAVLRALAPQFRVHLLVVPLYASPAPEIPADLVSLCAATAIVPPALAAPRRGLPVPFGRQPPPAAFQSKRFDVIHYFRLATLPFGAAYQAGHWGHAQRRHLDLDDVESVARRRLADLFRRNGRVAEAAFEEREAARCQILEDRVLREFDRVYVCSTLDRERLLPQSKAEVRVLHNAVELPAVQPTRPSLDPADEPPFNFLFVGTLGYFPNEDAVLYFCREILPLLRRSALRAFRLQVLGTGPTPALLAGTRQPEAEVVGPVADLAPWYAQAGAAIIPLRAGGGTRIKALEAFAHRTPVVTTSAGIEGIDAVDGEHLLIADSPAEFAAACLRLMTDPALAARLAANAFDLVSQHYTIERMAAALAGTAGSQTSSP